MNGPCRLPVLHLCRASTFSFGLVICGFLLFFSLENTVQIFEQPQDKTDYF